MTISILGCGWYGLPLAKDLVAKGYKVNGSTTSADKLSVLNADGITPFLIDLKAETKLNAEFFNADVLVISIPPKSRTGEGAEYVPKLQRVIDAIKVSPIKKVVLISSTGVYADLNKIVTEETDPQPNTPAGKILLEAEQLFSSQTAFKTTIIRFGGLLGPGRDPGRFFAGKKNIPNGMSPVNLIHLIDCIGIANAVIEHDIFGYILNGCTPHHPTKADFYTQATAKANLEPPDFVMQLKEWKIVSSTVVNTLLSYKFKIENWNDWLQ